MFFIKKYLSKEKLLIIGQKSFNIGVFSLCSLLPLSIFFLLISLIISLVSNKIKLIKDKWNLTLFISFGIIFFNSLYLLFNYPEYDKSTILVNFFRWTILFTLFSSAQYYLKNSSSRINFAKSFVLGSIPLLLSCIAQHIFEIYGPFRFLNGLIIWYNKPMIIPEQGISGLFSNQNYTGLWLSLLWPFCIYFIYINKDNKVKKILYFFLTLITLYYIFMTSSRAAVIGILISLPIISSIKIISLLILFAILFYFVFIYFPVNLSEQYIIYIPKNIKLILTKFSSLNLFNLNNFPRIIIWKNTIDFIIAKPIIGYGAGIFGIFYISLNEKFGAQHAHNLILQIAFDYGIPLSLILTSFLLVLLYKGWVEIFKNNNKLNEFNHYFDKCLFASTLIALISQLYDVTYFDGRVAIIIWLMLAGIKSTIEDKHNSSIK